MSILQEAVFDIVNKNIGEPVMQKVLIFDTQSGLAKMISDAYRIALGQEVQCYDFDQIEWENLDLRNILIQLPAGSLVVMVQSTNFRITDFRIRVELSQHGIHCIEHNHLGYLPEEHYDTYIRSLKYRTPDYVRSTALLNELSEDGQWLELVDKSGLRLKFWALEKFRGNTGDYSKDAVKWWTYPIGEAFSEAKDLSQVTGSAQIFAYPDEKFQIILCEPFTLNIVQGKVIHDATHPAGFLRLMDMIRTHEAGEVLVRELGIGFNTEISGTAPMSDVNAFERQLGVHLSLGKKHGIFGKKLPKTELQKYHIDVFLNIDYLDFSGQKVVFNQENILEKIGE